MAATFSSASPVSVYARGTSESPAPGHLHLQALSCVSYGDDTHILKGTALVADPKVDRIKIHHDFDKEGNWRDAISDRVASRVRLDLDGDVQQLPFSLMVPHAASHLELCLYLTNINGEDVWDNNGTKNYVIDLPHLGRHASSRIQVQALGGFQVD